MEYNEILKESQKTICKLRLLISGHPDCVDGSEFADYVSLAINQERKIKELLNKKTNETN